VFVRHQPRLPLLVADPFNERTIVNLCIASLWKSGVRFETSDEKTLVARTTQKS
jgi:hypothetical protein